MGMRAGASMGVGPLRRKIRILRGSEKGVEHAPSRAVGINAVSRPVLGLRSSIFECLRQCYLPVERREH
eukprot:3881026-Alexandrium_andersonii.AAC.1